MYEYEDPRFNHSHEYLIPALVSILDRHVLFRNERIFELGFGNGSVADLLSKKGYEIEGVDPSKQGVIQAKRNFPALKLEFGHSGENLVARFGTFQALYSLEVIEHVFDPYEYIATVNSLLDIHGICVVSTPYHSYLKNLLISIMGKWDSHFTVLWRGGHIKFWSPKSISKLMSENGFEVIEIVRVGRLPVIAKSMVVVARKREQLLPLN